MDGTFLWPITSALYSQEKEKAIDSGSENEPELREEFCSPWQEKQQKMSRARFFRFCDISHWLLLSLPVLAGIPNIFLLLIFIQRLKSDPNFFSVVLIGRAKVIHMNFLDVWVQGK